MEDGEFPEIRIEIEGTNSIYKAQVTLGTVADLGPVTDIDQARLLYLNKKLWLNQGSFRTHDETKDFDEPVSVKNLSLVTVTDIVAGVDNERPVRFIIKTEDGTEGYVDVHMSDTNVSDMLKDKNQFLTVFSVEDPHKKFDWSSRIWDALTNKKVLVGMTIQQAKMSWGDPQSVNSTTTGNSHHEQWVYKGQQVLYFDDGKLTTIQN